MKFKILSLLLIVSLSAVAGDEDCKDGVTTADKIVKAVKDKNCPNKSKMENLCSAISIQTPGQEKYYLSVIQEAVCIDKEKDSPAQQIEKIQKAWAKFEDILICNSIEHQFKNQNILKFAFIYEHETFIRDAIKWKVNLNKIDQADGLTVLDYIESHINKNIGNEYEPTYRNYYLRLRKAGAKHKREL